MSVVGQNEILELTIKQSVIENAVKTYAFSKKYIRMAVKAVLINVLYHRLNFPDNLFNNKKFHDVPYMAFKTDVKHRIIGHYSKWMKGFQDAFDKDYLQEFYLFMSNTDTKNIEECYEFKFCYKKDAGRSKRPNLIETTIDLFKELNNLKNIPKLDDNKTVIDVEFYYQSDTPKLYQPPYFEEELFENTVLKKKLENFEDKPKHQLCRLITGFHGFKFKARGEMVGALLQEQPVSEYEANDVVASGSFVEADKNPVGSNKSATEFNKSLIVLDDLDVKEDIDVHTINSSETPYETVTDSLFCGDISLGNNGIRSGIRWHHGSDGSNEMERVGDCSFNVSHIASSNGGKENVEPPRFLIRSNKDSQYLERDTPESMGIKRKIALKGTPRKMRRLSQ